MYVCGASSSFINLQCYYEKTCTVFRRTDWFQVGWLQPLSNYLNSTRVYFYNLRMFAYLPLNSNFGPTEFPHSVLYCMTTFSGSLHC